MKKTIRIMPVLILLVFVLTFTANAAVKINKKRISINPGNTYQLKIKGTKKAVKWSSSNKKVATVSKNGLVKGLRKGTCKVKAKVGKKSFTCKVNVKDSENKKPSIQDYYETIVLSTANASKYFSVQSYQSVDEIDNTKHTTWTITWINKDCYCVFYESDIHYKLNISYDYVDESGKVSHDTVTWERKGSTFHDSALPPDNAYNIKVEFIIANGTLTAVKKEGITRIELGGGSTADILYLKDPTVLSLPSLFKIA